MASIHVGTVESKPMPKDYSDPREQDVAERRAAAVKRIHENELNRLDEILVNYEIAKANAKETIRHFCNEFGSNHVSEWVLEIAKALGQKL